MTTLNTGSGLVEAPAPALSPCLLTELHAGLQKVSKGFAAEVIKFDKLLSESGDLQEDDKRLRIEGEQVRNTAMLASTLEIVRPAPHTSTDGACVARFERMVNQVTSRHHYGVQQCTCTGRNGMPGAASASQ